MSWPGLQPPDAGRVLFGDIDVYALGEGRRDRWRRHSIGLDLPGLPPHSRALDPRQRDPPGDLRARRERPERHRVPRSASACPTAGRTVNVLSRGEQQRVAIARAMAFDPPVILADEPTASLDAVAGAEIRAVLRELAGNGRTIVVVSHDPAIVSSADSVLRLERGMKTPEQALAA